MKAIFIDGNSIALRELPEPERVPGEALIRVGMCGICRTDLELASGYMGFSGVPGHEFVGTVQEADDKSLIGKRVVGEINCSCNECRWCLNGMHRHCPNRTVLGILARQGALAEKILLPERNLWIVPDRLSDDAAVLVEPLAAAHRLEEQELLAGISNVAVLGDGKLGLLVALVLSERIPDLLVFGKHARKLCILESLGITAQKLDLSTTPVDAFDLVVDVTGSPGGLELAIQLCKPCGRIILKTTARTPTEADLAIAVVKEIEIRGSRCGPFGRALDTLLSGRIPVDQMVENVYPLSEGVKAFGLAGMPGAKKVLVKCS